MRIYVGNLPFETTATDLQGLFSPHGSVADVVLPMDRDTGKPKGFAFVEMSSQEEAQRAINALNNKDFNSRTLNVNEARPKPARSGGFGR